MLQLALAGFHGDGADAVFAVEIDLGAGLGFQGLFPLFQSREDSVRDPRIDELVHVVEHIFDLYARLMSEAAAVGQRGLIEELTPGLKRLAAWWDRFATAAVSDVRRLTGAEAVASAEHVAAALGRWHERGEATADLAFWREHLESFRTPKAFALAIVGAEYLLRWLPRGTHDWRKFVRPSELAKGLRRGGLAIEALTGVAYDPISGRWRLTPDLDVNYMMAASRPPA